MKKICVVVAILITCMTGLTVFTTADMVEAAQTKKSTTTQLATKVNINTADLAILSELPGIGPKTASAIMEYRKKNGNFTTVDQLLQIKGIGDKKLTKIKPYLAKL